MACTQVMQFERSVKSTAVAPDGQLLAVGLVFDGVQLLDAHSSMRLSRRLDMVSDHVVSLAFSPACSSPLLLAAGSDDGTVQVWDCSSSASVAELHGHSRTVRCVTFSPDGRLLASASRDQTVRLWRTDDWLAPPTVLSDYTDYVYGVSFSCDGRLLASCPLDGTVKLWHILDSGAAAAAAAAVATAGPVLEVGQPLLCVAFSPVDSRLLACGGKNGFLALLRVGAGDGVIAVERKLQGHTDYVRSLAFSPCGRTLASGSLDLTVRLWSVTSGASLRVLRGHTNIVDAVAFFPNGKHWPHSPMTPCASGRCARGATRHTTCLASRSRRRSSL